MNRYHRNRYLSLEFREDVVIFNKTSHQLLQFSIKRRRNCIEAVNSYEGLSCLLRKERKRRYRPNIVQNERESNCLLHFVLNYGK